jgi:NAD+-dependent protein deacetylase SIR2
MKVAPVSEIPRVMPPRVPHIYISLDPVHHINFDVTLLGQCDAVVTELCKRAGWDLKHDMIPTDVHTIVEPVEGHEGRHRVYTALDEEV